MKLPEFSAYAPARLREARPAATEQAFLAIEPPPGFVEAHEHPGQFCKMRVGEDEGIFAMLSAPSEPPRFLVRVGNPVGGEAADALAALDDGAPIEMTLPAGDGFGLAAARGKDLRFVATGTGVAPVCAAIEHALRDRDAYGAISLDHGLKSEGHLAIAQDAARWRAAGVEVRVVYSSFDGERLHGTSVQASLRAAVPDLSGAAVIAVGQGAMLASLREVVAACGGDPDGILTNI